MGRTDSLDQVHARFDRIVESDDHFIVLAFDGNVPVGYAWAQDRGPHLRSGWRNARLHDLFVAPAHRRRGIGRRLFVTAQAWTRSRGVRWLEWQASRDALGFYERLGVNGDPCPDPEHPYFEIDFGDATYDRRDSATQRDPL